MRDQLDLEQLTQEIQQRKRRARYYRIARVLVFVLFFAAPVSLLARFTADSTPTGTLYYRHQGDDWQQVEELTGAPTDIQVSPSGMVWVQSVCPYQLSRFDGDSWQTYTEENFGGYVSCTQNGFSLVGEEVWAITCDGVAHFEGRLWSLHPEAVTGSCPEAITASESGVFTANSDGDLAHFDGDAWTRTHAADVLPGLDLEVYGDDPRLTQTPDGSVWLLFHGLWRYKDGLWNEILWNEERHVDWGVQLAGVDNRYLWLGEWGGLRLYEYGRDHWWGYDEADMSITEDTRVYEIAIRGEEYWVATADGIRVFKDETWRKDALPDAGAPARVVLAPDGAIWASSLIFNDPTTDELRQQTLITLIATLVIIISLVIAMRQLSRDRRRAAAILRVFTVGVKKPGVSLSSFLFLGIVALAAIVGVGADLSQVPFTILFAALIILVLLIAILPSRWLAGPVTQLDHETALRRSEILGRLLPNDTNLLHLRGMILLHAGSYAQAAQLMRQSLLGVKRLSLFYQSGYLNNLAYPLLLQERYEEALHCLQGAILIYPEASNPYASLADVYLYQGIEPERALELMDYAMQNQQKSRKPTQGVHWATRAWALAMMGQHNEAAESLRRASVEINRDHKPLLAELEYISGEVNRLAGRPEEAKVYFNEVLAIDSQGMWRDRAERALRSMSTEPVGEPDARPA